MGRKGLKCRDKWLNQSQSSWGFESKEVITVLPVRPQAKVILMLYPSNPLGRTGQYHQNVPTDLTDIQVEGHTYTDFMSTPMQRDGSSSRMRIFYGDGNDHMVDNQTDYSGRIEVTLDQQGTQLTIQNVQLSDEREFFCQVNGLAAGSAEGKTHLKVFGEKTQSVMKCSYKALFKSYKRL